MRRSLWLLPLAAGLVFGAAELPKAQAGNLGDAVEASNAEQLSLARELKQAGVIFYGACRKAKIRAFPTWVLGDQRAEGVMTLPQLRSWAGL